MDEMKLKGVFTEANLEFQGKILERSGLGDETGLSDGIAAMKDGDLQTSLRAALDESEMVLYDVVEQLINKTGIDPQEVCCKLSALHSLAAVWPCSASMIFCEVCSAVCLHSAHCARQPDCCLLSLLVCVAVKQGGDSGFLLCRSTSL